MKTEIFIQGYRAGVVDGTITGAMVTFGVILGTALAMAIIIRLVRK